MGRVDGVYKSGFASTQKAYEAAVIPLFESLDRLEKMLQGKDYLIGDQLTEADIRLFVTIVRTILLSSPGSSRLSLMEIVIVVVCMYIDPLRSCVCRAFQVQPPDYSGWVPCHPPVRVRLPLSPNS